MVALPSPVSFGCHPCSQGMALYLAEVSILHTMSLIEGNTYISRLSFKSKLGKEVEIVEEHSIFSGHDSRFMFYCQGTAYLNE